MAVVQTCARGARVCYAIRGSIGRIGFSCAEAGQETSGLRSETATGFAPRGKRCGVRRSNRDG